MAHRCNERPSQRPDARCWTHEWRANNAVERAGSKNMERPKRAAQKRGWSGQSGARGATGKLKPHSSCHKAPTGLRRDRIRHRPQAKVTGASQLRDPTPPPTQGAHATCGAGSVSRLLRAARACTSIRPMRWPPVPISAQRNCGPPSSQPTNLCANSITRRFPICDWPDHRADHANGRHFHPGKQHPPAKHSMGVARRSHPSHLVPCASAIWRRKQTVHFHIRVARPPSHCGQALCERIGSRRVEQLSTTSRDVMSPTRD